MLSEVVGPLRAEARAANERRLLVLVGAPERCRAAAADALDTADVDLRSATLVGTHAALDCEQLAPHDADRLMGTTREAVVFDAHDGCHPNALGQVVGTVEGGGLLVLLAPPLDGWPALRDGFADTLAVPPYAPSDVTGHFRRRLVETLRSHPGVAIVDVDAGAVERDGLTHPAPRLPADPVSAPDDHAFPDAAYRACRTRDQATALSALERLRGEGPTAVVIEADRGRGKSSATGLAAACLAASGRDVLVTAPDHANAAALFDRAAALLVDLESLVSSDGVPPRLLVTDIGGRIRFELPATATDRPGDPDVVLVDEAAALPVRTLSALLAADRLAFVTTVHGYEGAGRGFDVRFRPALEGSRHDVHEVRLDEPIRYAAGDPVEVWAFRALGLDARPAVEQVVADADPSSVEYRRFESADLLADENLLRETFGLLVTAHYRTEPNDLARLLDAPNLDVRALAFGSHVVSVALLAREGDLPAGLRAEIYEGARVRGNMLPDVLTSQLRDESAGVPSGVRVLRIATHHAARSRGLGSRLLSAVREEVGEAVDWLGVGYGATPELVRFWEANGFSTVHVSTTRNERSGEYSALMLAPTSERGRALHDRHAAWFAERIEAMLTDALADVESDVVRAVLRACDATPPLDLSDRDWRLVAGAAYGPAIYSVDPRPFRRLALHYLGRTELDLLTPRAERLLVSKVLQGRPTAEVAERLDYPGTAACMRALGDAYRPLVDVFGTDAARAERDRY